MIMYRLSTVQAHTHTQYTYKQIRDTIKAGIKVQTQNGHMYGKTFK